MVSQRQSRPHGREGGEGEWRNTKLCLVLASPEAAREKKEGANNNYTYTYTQTPSYQRIHMYHDDVITVGDVDGAFTVVNAGETKDC
jgi:hypothetical protein